jgi:CarD family transcriptional regulator
MTFTVGETVVYPNHGAAVIEDIETRQIKGEDRLYLVLRIVGQTDLIVRVPACNLDLVGVRDVVDADGLERVFGVLRAPHTEEPTNWSRRYKANLEKLHSGNVMKVRSWSPSSLSRSGSPRTRRRSSWTRSLPLKQHPVHPVVTS